jgi:hypothetical protein
VYRRPLEELSLQPPGAAFIPDPRGAAGSAARYAVVFVGMHDHMAKILSLCEWRGCGGCAGSTRQTCVTAATHPCRPRALLLLLLLLLHSAPCPAC